MSIPVQPSAPILLYGAAVAGWLGKIWGLQSLPLSPGEDQLGSHSCLTTHFHETYWNLASLKYLS